MTTPNEDRSDVVEWSRRCMEDWGKELERERERERKKRLGNKVRAFVAFGMFTGIGLILAMAHPENPFNVGLGIAFILFGAVIAAYEWSIDD